LNYIKKKMAPWEIKYGQIRIGEYDLAKEIFKNYFGKTFELITFQGNFPNQNFLHYEEKRNLRFSCRLFFKNLSEGDIIYIKPIDLYKIGIYEEEPIEDIEAIIEDESKIKIINKSDPEVMRLLIDLIKDNISLRKENEYLLTFKEQLDKYQNLDLIFDDEKAMEDWLERNIHRAIPDLEVIDRQIYLNWGHSFMKDRVDLFCINKTTKELVIIENKVKRRFRKVDTQYMKYSSWVKRNLKQIKEKYSDLELKPTENFKFVIITDESNEKLEAICEDFNIGLVLVEGRVNIEELVPYSLE